jgi:hypothetical protein
MNKPPQVTLIHATEVAMQPIQSAFAAGWPEARLVNLLDDSLTSSLCVRSTAERIEPRDPSAEPYDRPRHSTVAKSTVHRSRRPGQFRERGAGTDQLKVSNVAAFVREHEGRAPLVFSSDSPDKVAACQACPGTEAVAHAIERLFADTARALVKTGIRRLVVAVVRPRAQL